MKAAVFLDRDGVINQNVFYLSSGEWEGPRIPADVVLVAGAVDALRQLQSSGFELFIVTNQPNLAKGKASLAQIEAVHSGIMSALDAARIAIRQTYMCLHHPHGIVPEFSGCCRCRKPSPYFLLEAAKTYGIDLTSSWMVGDRDSDIECGRAAGARTVRIAADHPGEPEPIIAADFDAADLGEASAIIRSSIA